MSTRVRLWQRAVVASSGLLWLTTCGVSDIALRDYAISITIRTFIQTLGTALQAAIVGSAGAA